MMQLTMVDICSLKSQTGIKTVAGPKIYKQERKDLAGFGNL